MQLFDVVQNKLYSKISSRYHKKLVVVFMVYRGPQNAYIFVNETSNFMSPVHCVSLYVGFIWAYTGD